MAKFDLSKQKRGRKVKRKKKPTNEKTLPEQRKQISFELTPISEKLPPQEVTQILVWDNNIGWHINTAILVYQHYFQDIKMLGYSRARYWTFLD